MGIFRPRTASDVSRPPLSGAGATDPHRARTPAGAAGDRCRAHHGRAAALRPRHCLFRRLPRLFRRQPDACHARDAGDDLLHGLRAVLHRGSPRPDGRRGHPLPPRHPDRGSLAGDVARRRLSGLAPDALGAAFLGRRDRRRGGADLRPCPGDRQAIGPAGHGRRIRRRQHHRAAALYQPLRLWPFRVLGGAAGHAARAFPADMAVAGPGIAGADAADAGVFLLLLLSGLPRSSAPFHPGDDPAPGHHVALAPDAGRALGRPLARAGGGAAGRLDVALMARDEDAHLRTHHRPVCRDPRSGLRDRPTGRRRPFPRFQ